MNKGIAILLFILSGLGFSIAGIMFYMLSFVDYPYLIGGIVFGILGLWMFKRSSVKGSTAGHDKK